MEILFESRADPQTESSMTYVISIFTITLTEVKQHTLLNHSLCTHPRSHSRKHSGVLKVADSPKTSRSLSLTIKMISTLLDSSPY
jgi:hypothetical protein